MIDCVLGKVVGEYEAKVENIVTEGKERHMRELKILRMSGGHIMRKRRRYGRTKYKMRRKIKSENVNIRGPKSETLTTITISQNIGETATSEIRDREKSKVKSSPEKNEKVTNLRQRKEISPGINKIAQIFEPWLMILMLI